MRTAGLHLLSTVRSDLTGSAAFSFVVAARRLEGEPDLPIAARVVSLPLSVLGQAAVLQPMPRGRPADVTGNGSAALAALGRTLGAIASVPQALLGVPA